MPIRIPANYLVHIDTKVYKVRQNTQKDQHNTEWEDKVRKLLLMNFKTYYRAVIIKAGWYWWKNSQLGQWNRKQSPEIDPHKYSQLVFDKGTNGGKNSLFHQCYSNETSPCAHTQTRKNRHYTHTLYFSQKYTENGL